MRSIHTALYTLPSALLHSRVPTRLFMSMPIMFFFASLPLRCPMQFWQEATQTSTGT